MLLRCLFKRRGWARKASYDWPGLGYARTIQLVQSFTISSVLKWPRDLKGKATGSRSPTPSFRASTFARHASAHQYNTLNTQATLLGKIQVQQAWCWILQSQDISTLALLAIVANVSRPDSPCPNGVNVSSVRPDKVEVTRLWYSIRNPDDLGNLMDQFTICSLCVTSIYKLLLSVAKARPFISVSSSPCAGSCDILPGLSRRSSLYISRLMAAEWDALASETAADPENFSRTVSRFAHNAECVGNELAYGKCYTYHGFRALRCPRIESGSDLASMFGFPVDAPQGFYCQLYSQRMRDIWNKAACKIQAEYHESMATMEQSLEFSRTLCTQIATGDIPTTDFSKFNRLQEAARHEGMENIIGIGSKILHELYTVNLLKPRSDGWIFFEVNVLVVVLPLNFYIYTKMSHPFHALLDQNQIQHVNRAASTFNGHLRQAEWLPIPPFLSG
ncbi:uncharacterized protein BDR25DRAFT_362750 [Lindgomyces ingoldianus]|uniref:Uncharacterized protein n=1 Tax=Lindgomyces ingoldianus TaxID=673940 RepID=A0ACB6Q9I3_9PLEO|nr:uncharacterized protein BDR25DRAFT_362750 [Lindgomyces ingoldianus]KAF2463569.1 hypothetical protein BDR25DRAFT_362750 [Lindgomyces ingoldianus]